MAKSREHFALDWIKSELLETLNGAREALEVFVESDRDETRMRACLTGLHQVHGTLIMLELSGVTLLADHLEQLAQKMLADQVEDEPGASQTLMQGILELPGHIDEIQRGAPDKLQNVVLLVNEVRGHLGQAAIVLENDVTAISGEAPESALTRFADINGVEKARKIRAAYQQVLLSILKGEDLAGSVVMLGKVAQGLQRVCKGTPHELQWQAFGELVSSLDKHTGPLEGSVVKLLRRVDSEIRTLSQNGIESLKVGVSSELVEQLLDAATAFDHQSDTVDRLRGMLEQTGTPEGGVSISGRQALASAAAALREELLLVKDRLDLIVRAEKQSGKELLGLIAPLKQIGSTLSLLGFESSKTIVADQIEALNQISDGGELDPAALMSIASALVQVDENLASFSQGGKNEVEKIVDEAERAVTVEARQGLDQVKQDIVDYISSEWDPRHLAETSARIEGICGALDIIPLVRVSRLLSSCGRYIADRLIRGDAPSWQEMDQFADAISGVDYYLERVGEESSFGVEDVLDLVERSLSTLGVDFSVVVGADTATVDMPVASADTLQQVSDEPTGSAADEPEQTFGVDTEEEDEPKLELEFDAGFDLDTNSFASFDDTVEEPVDEIEVESDTALEATEPVFEEPVSSVPAVPTDPSLLDSFESDADIVEIFVEEVGEVLESVDEWLPAWREELSHEEALGEIRRGFHTLKGSGRIVGANVI
ncbi:MAG: Hpt domain-containing protein, partial [Pseudomonadales bacterium]